MKTKIRVTMSIMLAVAIILGIGATGIGAGGTNQSTTPVPSGDATITEKSEVVYARLSNDGNVNNIHVVNHFTLAAGGTFTDYGNYTSVVNLTDLHPLTYANGAVTARTGSDNFFYQGNLAKSDLPWIYSIEYTLDGAKISPENLAGKTGALEIRLTSTPSTSNNTTHDVFHDNYMQQITITLDIDKSANIEADGATVASAGKDRMLAFTVLPGNDADITVTADVTDFEMPGIEIAAMPFGMSIELPDTTEMVDEFTTLSDAIAELNDGVGELRDGAEEMASGANDLYKGSREIYNGLTQLSSNSTQLTDGSAQINNALKQIAKGLENMPEMDLADLAALPEALTGAATGLKGVSLGLKQLRGSDAQPGYAQAYNAVADAASKIPNTTVDGEAILALMEKIGADESVAATANALIAGYTAGMTFKGAQQAFASVVPTLDTLTTHIDTISTGLETMSAAITTALADIGETDITPLVNGIAELSKNYGTFHKGLVAYTQGVKDLSSGYREFNSGIAEFSDGVTEMSDGIAELHDGTTEMATETSDMPGQIQSEIDSLLDDYMGGDFEAVSFTSSENGNISFVQFVFMTEGITKPETDPTPETETKQPTIWDRFLDLFR